MKPAPGNYRLTDSSGGTSKSEDLTITANGATGPFGEPWSWVVVDGHDILKSGWRTLSLEWTSQNGGDAVFGTPPNTTLVPFASALRT